MIHIGTADMRAPAPADSNCPKHLSPDLNASLHHLLAAGKGSLIGRL